MCIMAACASAVGGEFDRGFRGQMQAWGSQLHGDAQDGLSAQEFTCALLWFMQQAASSRIELSRILHAG